MRNAVIIVLILSIVFGIWFWLQGSKLLNRPKTEAPKDITLTVWGLNDDQSVYNDILEKYHQIRPNIRVNYVKQNLLNYKTRVQAQIKAGEGPDIFMFYNSSLPTFIDYLAPAPDTIFTSSDYTSAFYPIAEESLTNRNGIYGVPIEIDGLAMYYNEDLLNAKKLSVPTTWQQFSDEAKQLTVMDDQGQIQVAGAALGTTSNVDFWSEIIGLLFYEQPNASLITPGNSAGGEVLQFYTQFVTDPKNKTWDTTLPSSTEMFKEGKLAFYFGDSKEASAFQAAGPDLHFKTAPVPQIPGKNIAWAGFWAYGVSKSSSYSTEAWDFLKYLTESPSLRTIYENQSQQRIIASPFARPDMAGILASDPILGTFVNQGPNYKTWYLNQNTQDFGINDEMVGLYQGPTNQALQGGDPVGALSQIESNIQATLAKYNAK